jgi:hypothetical protein
LTDVAHTYAVEAEITRMIERRSRKGDVDADDREELWMESVRRFHERRREQNRWEWVRYFDRMAQSHAKLSKDYRERAELLCEEEPGEGRKL